MSEETLTMGQQKECCQQEANLKVIESTMSMTVRRCAVCGCRHFEVIADTGSLFAKPTE